MVLLLWLWIEYKQEVHRLLHWLSPTLSPLHSTLALWCTNYAGTKMSIIGTQSIEHNASKIGRFWEKITSFRGGACTLILSIYSQRQTTWRFTMATSTECSDLSDGNEVCSSSQVTSSAAPSLLSKLWAPPQSELMRKRKISHFKIDEHHVTLWA